MAMIHLSVFVLLVTVCRFSESADSLSNVSVCLGDQLRVTCRLQQTNDSFFNWDVETANGSTNNFTFLGYAPGYMTRVFVVDGVEFLVTLLSTSDDPRALTEMFIRNVSANLNGTRAKCSSSFGRRVSTLITVVTNVTITNPVIAINERFDRDFVTVLLEWTVQEHVSYNITVTPAGSYYSLRPVITGNGSASQELTLAYNVMYNVSFVATRCQANVSRVFQFQYVKCGYPLSSSDDVIGSVSGYSDPALVGSNATVWCPNQLTGSSPTVITCMSNGNWNPEPGMIIQACSDLISTESTKTTHNNVSISSSNSLLVTSVAVLSTLIVSSIIFFLIGCLCGWFGHKRKQSSTNETESDSFQQTTPTPAYEDVVSKTQATNNETAFELENNTAYGRVKPI